MVKQWIPFLVAALLILGGLYLLMVTLGYVEAIGPLPWALLSGLGGLAFLAVYLQDRREWWPLIPGAALLSLSLTILLGMAGLPSGAAGSWSLSNLGPRIMANNFDPGFFVEHFIKDMGIALEEAQKMGLALPGLALAHQLYLGLKAQGHGRNGTQALALVLSRLSGIDWTKR